MKSRPSRKTFRARLDELINTLREEIMTGRRPSGSFLPSEKDFAEQYSLSNQSVRKGLEILAGEGLIVKIPRVGNRVADLAANRTATIKLGYHPTVVHETMIHYLLSLFQSHCPHIHVQIVPLTSFSCDTLRQYMDNGMLDVVTMNMTGFGEFREKGCLDYLLPQEPEPDIYPFLQEGFTEQGSLLVKPFVFSPVILCYNRNHFMERRLAPPDSSWDWGQLFDAADRLQIPNERMGLYIHMASPNRWPVFLLQSGASFAEVATGASLRESPMMEAIRMTRELVSRRLPPMPVGVGQGDTERLLLQGKASMIVTSYFNLNYLKDGDVPYEVAPLPRFKNASTLLLNIGLAVNRRAGHPEAAGELVRFLTSFRAQQLIRRNTLSIPARKAAAEWTDRETMYRPARFQIFREMIPDYRRIDDLHLRQGELSILYEELQLYWSGLENDDTFCSRLLQRLNQSREHRSPATARLP